MNSELILMLIAAYLRELNNPTETPVQIAGGITDDLIAFRAYLNDLDKTNIDQ